MHGTPDKRTLIITAHGHVVGLSTASTHLQVLCIGAHSLLGLLPRLHAMPRLTCNDVQCTTPALHFLHNMQLLSPL